MKKILHQTESLFEKFSESALRVFGSSISFIIALIISIAYVATIPFSKQTFHASIYDIILCFTFLGFFIIQKTFNKYNTALNLKINELVSAHDNASNRMVNIEKKTEAELLELAKYYNKIADESELNGELQTPKSIEHILEKQKKEDEKINDDTINKGNNS